MKQISLITLVLLSLVSCRSIKKSTQVHNASLQTLATQVESFRWLGTINIDSITAREIITEYDSLGSVKKVTNRELTQVKELKMQSINEIQSEKTEIQHQISKINQQSEVQKKPPNFKRWIVGIIIIIAVFIFGRFGGFKLISGIIAHIFRKN